MFGKASGKDQESRIGEDGLFRWPKLTISSIKYTTVKLILCLTCNDIFNLKTHKYQRCTCGHSGGVYVNEIHAKVHGTREKTVVLGFANGTLANAIRQQIDQGDLPATMPYCGKMVSPGRDFTAFVIPEGADSVTWTDFDDTAFK